MPTNEMTLAKAFRDAGIEQGKAEHLAETIFDAIRDNVATKADLDHAIERLEHRLTLRGLGALATGLGALFAALHYWPPHMVP
jgi:hypothetical protein